ncbi:ATP-binding protein [Methylomonas methanica]|nr:ATP-binding protein [Methylomonas methanica]
MQMKDSEQRAKDLIAALEAAANGCWEDFVLNGDPELEQATARLFAKVRSLHSESNRAMSNIANADVRMLLWREALQKINAADSLFHHGGKLADFYQSIVVEAMQMTRARYGALGLFDEDGNLEQFITEGMDAETIAGIGHPPEGRGLLKALLNECTPVSVDSIADDPRFIGFPPGHPPMRTLISAPLVVSYRLKGVIYLADKEIGEFFDPQKQVYAEKFTEEDEDMLGLFADYLVRSLERTDLVIALQQSNKDLEKERSTLQEMVEKLRDTQNQLLQAEKMASIGQLAAGVAHEINNPIGFVNSNLGTLAGYIEDMFSVIDAYEQTVAEVDQNLIDREKIDSLRKKLQFELLREDVPDLLHESRDGLARVKNIVNDLKDFSRMPAAEWQYVDLHQGLESTLNIVGNEIKYKADVVRNYGVLPEVECLPSQLNQVFLNLLMNAAQAISERGTIILSSGTEKETVWVAITDSGQGISPKNLSRIFEPFFTTKPVGKGTGLGLSLSYSIVQKHHGRIEVGSKVGEGTTFRVVLPVKQPTKIEM